MVSTNAEIVRGEVRYVGSFRAKSGMVIGDMLNDEGASKLAVVCLSGDLFSNSVPKIETVVRAWYDGKKK